MGNEAPEVRVGQVWADNDSRQEGRTLCVLYVGRATVSVRIMRTRFRPTSTGYRLVRDVDDLSDSRSGGPARG